MTFLRCRLLLRVLVVVRALLVLVIISHGESVTACDTGSGVRDAPHGPPTATTPTRIDHAALKRAIQPVLANLARQYNTSLYYGLVATEASLGLAEGVDDRA